MLDRDCACHAPELKDASHLVFAFVEITPACNNRCSGCSNVYLDQRQAAAMPVTAWETLLKSIRPYVDYVKLTGGEPTLYPAFSRLLEVLEALDLPFTLFTNARWHAPETLVAALRHAPGLQGLLISLHGVTAPTHEAFSSVPGSFVETLANLRRALDAAIPCTLSMVITRHNWDQIEAMIELAQRLGAEGVAFNRYIGAPLPELEPTPAQLYEALQRIEAAQRSGAAVKFGVPLSLCQSEAAASPCLAGEAFVTIDPWGKVRPCNHAPVVLGDLQSQTLPEILATPATQQWRNWVPETCRTCGFRATCRGGCRAEALLRPATSYVWSPSPRSERVFTVA